MSVSPASGSLEPLPSKLTVSGAGPLVGVAVRDGDRRPVAAEVADPADRAAVEVGVEEVAARADLRGRPGSLRGVTNVGRSAGFGQAVRARGHRPDAVARVVGEEQRAVVRGGVAAAARRREREPGDRRAAGRTRLAGHDLRAVVVGEVRRGRPPPVRRRGSRRCSGSRCRSRTARRRPRSTASRSSRRTASVGLAIAVDLLPGVPADVADQTSFVPGRIVKRNGLRRPYATIRRAFASGARARAGCPGRPAPGARVDAQDRAVERRRVGRACGGPGCAARRPRRSAGERRRAAGGSPHGLSGFPSWP